MDLTTNIRINWQKLLAVIKYIYTPLILLCLFLFVIKNKLVLVDLFCQAKLGYLLIAILFWTILHLLAPFSVLLFLRAKNYNLHFHTLLSIYISRLPARYLPGGIWHTVARMHDYHSYGVSKKDLTHLALFETIFPIPFSLFAGTLILKATPLTPLPNYLLNIILFISCIILVFPLFSAKFICRTANSLRKYYFFILLFSFSFWLIASTSFFIYLHSFSLSSSINESYLSVTGAYILSWGAGYIAIFAPQGIGVFEVVLAKIIELPMNLGSSVAFLAGFRLIALFADFIVFFLHKLIFLKSKVKS